MYGGDPDDQQIQDWLNSLRDGTRAEKISARRSLARVFEQRGMLEEAVELLENNVRAGVRVAPHTTVMGPSAYLEQVVPAPDRPRSKGVLPTDDVDQRFLLM
jgi:hypothetical protein